jgi:hypothetical protein
MESLTVDTPGVLVGMPYGTQFTRVPVPSSFLDAKEIELATLWSQGLGTLQEITLIYGCELYSGNFVDHDGKEGRHSVLFKEVGHWIQDSSSS